MIVLHFAIASLGQPRHLASFSESQPDVFLFPTTRPMRTTTLAFWGWPSPSKPTMASPSHVSLFFPACANLADFSLAAFSSCNVFILIIGMVDIVVHQQLKVADGCTIPMGSSPHSEGECFVSAEFRWRAWPSRSPFATSPHSARTDLESLPADWHTSSFQTGSLPKPRTR